MSMINIIWVLPPIDKCKFKPIIQMPVTRLTSFYACCYKFECDAVQTHIRKRQNEQTVKKSHNVFDDVNSNACGWS